MTGKEKIINYCTKTLKTISVEYLEKCRDAKRILEQKDVDILYLSDCGCPFNYGLDNYKGLCESETARPKEQTNQCKKCWEVALR